MDNRDQNWMNMRVRRTHPFYTTFNLFSDSGIVLPNLRMNPAWFKQLDTGEPFVLKTDEYFPDLFPGGRIGSEVQQEWILSYHLEGDDSIPSIKFKRYDPLDIVIDHLFHTGITNEKEAFVVNVHNRLERKCMDMEPDQIISLWNNQYNYFICNPLDKSPSDFLSWTKDLISSWSSPHRFIIMEWIRCKKLSITTSEKLQSRFWQNSPELINRFWTMLIGEDFIADIDQDAFFSLMFNSTHDFSIKANWIGDKRKLVAMFDLMQKVHRVFGSDHLLGDVTDYKAELRVKPQSIANRFIHRGRSINAKKLSDERQAALLSSWAGEMEDLIRSI